MKIDYLELYTDYLISRNGYAAETGLSSMMDEEISHDKITRSVSQNEFTSKDSWLKVKKATARESGSEDRCLIFDDTNQESNNTEQSHIFSSIFFF